MKIKSIILVCMALGNYCFSQENNPIADINKIHEFIPKWSKGDTWEMKVIYLQEEYYTPILALGESAQMTVLEMPSKDTSGCYVLSYVGDRTKDCAFFLLDAKDLSLRQYRKASIEGLTDDELKQKLADWRNTEPSGFLEGDGNPIILSHGWAYFVFPTLKQNNNFNKNEYTTRYNKQRTAQATEIGNVDGKHALIVNIVSSDHERERYWERLKTGQYNATLVWQKGDPWWTSATFFDSQGEVRRRIELVKSYKELKGKDTPGKFEVLYSRWKQAGDTNNIIEKREYYYRMLNLGRDTLPFMVEKLKSGDEEIIKAISEITGGVMRTATKAECLEWWERVKKYEGSRKQHK